MKLIDSFFDLLFPKVCLGCSSLLNSGENILCVSCSFDLPITNHHLVVENDAFKRLYGRVDCHRIMSMLYFEKDGVVQQLIHNLKYKGHQDVGAFLGNWYFDLVSDQLNEIDFIVPVPLHKSRLKSRGYNQVITFCKAFSEGLQKPILDNVLIRNKNLKTQSKKTLSSRTSITNRVFQVKNYEIFSGKHFLLIDDILTTGTTLEQCIKALQEIPEIKISVITMAYTK